MGAVKQRGVRAPSNEGYPLEMRAWIGVAIALCACGPNEVVGTDAGGGMGSGTEGDIIGVQCQMHARNVRNTDGSRTESRSYFALVDVAPTDDFRLEVCSPTTTYLTPAPPDCPSGAVCADSGEPLADPAAICTWSRGSGSFVDGRLLVNCGSGFSSWDSSGTLTVGYDYRYATIRVHR